MDLANDYTTQRTLYGGDAWLEQRLEQRRIALERNAADHPGPRHLEEYRFRVHVPRFHWPHRHAHAMLPIAR